MAGYTPTQELTAVATGTLSVDVAQSATREPLNIRVSNAGTITLTGNLNIYPTGTAIKNTLVIVRWEGNITPSRGKDLIIFGKTIPQALLNTASTDNPFVATCFYNGSAWIVNVSADAGGSEYIGSDAIADAAIVADKIGLLAVTTAKIADISVTTAKIAENAITTAKMALLSVTTAVINDLAVTTGKIAALAITTAKLDAAAVTTAKIADANVTAAKIADKAITHAKLEDNANRYTRDFTVSFEAAGKVGVLNFPVCEDCTIEKVSATVMSPFADDAGTIIFKNNAGTVMTGSQIDLGTGLILGNQVTNTVTSNNTFTAGQKITFETSKTTKTSGLVNVSLCIIKT